MHQYTFQTARYNLGKLIKLFWPGFAQLNKTPPDELDINAICFVVLLALVTFFLHSAINSVSGGTICYMCLQMAR